MGGYRPGGYCRGGMLSGGILSGGILSGAMLSGGCCPGGIVRRDIALIPFQILYTTTTTISDFLGFY